jgi:hypothetical protein
MTARSPTRPGSSKFLGLVCASAGMRMVANPVAPVFDTNRLKTSVHQLRRGRHRHRCGREKDGLRGAPRSQVKTPPLCAQRSARPPPHAAPDRCSVSRSQTTALRPGSYREAARHLAAQQDTAVVLEIKINRGTKIKTVTEPRRITETGNRKSCRTPLTAASSYPEGRSSFICTGFRTHRRHGPFESRRRCISIAHFVQCSRKQPPAVRVYAVRIATPNRHFLERCGGKIMRVLVSVSSIENVTLPSFAFAIAGPRLFSCFWA